MAKNKQLYTLAEARKILLAEECRTRREHSIWQEYDRDEWHGVCTRCGTRVRELPDG